MPIQPNQRVRIRRRRHTVHTYNCVVFTRPQTRTHTQRPFETNRKRSHDLAIFVCTTVSVDSARINETNKRKTKTKTQHTIIRWKMDYTRVRPGVNEMKTLNRQMSLMRWNEIQQVGWDEMEHRKWLIRFVSSVFFFHVFWGIQIVSNVYPKDEIKHQFWYQLQRCLTLNPIHVAHESAWNASCNVCTSVGRCTSLCMWMNRLWLNQ